MRVLVIGGTAFIGRHTVAELVREGHEIVLFHRGLTPSPFGNEVPELLGDRHDAAAVRRSLEGERFDGVVDIAYDRDRLTGAAEVAHVARAVRSTRPRYVYVSSVSVYAELGTSLSEESARGGPPDTYPRAKFEAEEALLAEHRQGHLEVSLVRPCLVYGPWNPMPRETWLWDRILVGRPVILPDDGTTLFHWTAVQDVAWALVKCLTDPGAAGEAFNVAEEAPLSHEALVDRLAKVAGRSIEKVQVPRQRLTQLGGSPRGPRLYFGSSLDSGEDFGVTVEKAKHVLGFRPTDPEDGWKAAFAWYLSYARKVDPDVAFEKAVLGR